MSLLARRIRAGTSAIALLALLGTGCGREWTPPGPTPVLAPDVHTYSYWRLTSTLASVTGTWPCGVDFPPIGTTIDWALEVRRAGSDIRLIYDAGDPNAAQLVGVVGDRSFTARETWTAGAPCGDHVYEGHVDGQFAPDGATLTARMTSTYRYRSGDVVVFTEDWVATKR